MLLGLAAIVALSLAGALQAADRPDVESQPLPARPSQRTANTNGAHKTAGPEKPKTSGTGWWGTIGSLTAVLALVFLSAKVLRKSLPAASRTLPPEVVQVLGRKALDYRNTIHLVRVGSKLLVLGSSQEGLSPLSEITDPVEVDSLSGLCQPEAAASVAHSFNQLFRRFQAHPEAEAEARHEIDSTSPDEAAPETDDETEGDIAVLRLKERLHPALHSEPDEEPQRHPREFAG